MVRFLRQLLLLIIGIAVIALAVANRHSVRFVLDPLSAQDAALSLEAPLFLLLFVAIFVGLVLGALGTWMGQSKWRHLARMRTKETHELRREQERLSRRLQSIEGDRLIGPPKLVRR